MDADRTSPLVLSPDAAELRRRLSAADRPRATAVRATGVSVFFQCAAERLCEGKGPHATETELIDSIAGPYCIGCRSALTATSFSEWTTAEARETPIPEHCARCGTALAESGRDSGMLRRVAAALIARALAGPPDAESAGPPVA